MNMSIVELLKDKSLKGTERRQAVVNMIVAGELTVNEVAAIATTIGEKQIATILEAVEEVSNKHLCPLEAAWLQWVTKVTVGSVLSDSKASGSPSMFTKCSIPSYSLSHPYLKAVFMTEAAALEMSLRFMSSAASSRNQESSIEWPGFMWLPRSPGTLPLSLPMTSWISDVSSRK